MKVRIFVSLSLIAVMAMLVPVSARSMTAAQSQPAIPVVSGPSEAEESITVLEQPQISAALQNAPLMFIENVGQLADGARFQVRGGDRAIWLAEDAIWVTVLEQTSEEAMEPGGKTPVHSHNSAPKARNGVNLRLSFTGANRHPRLKPFNRLDTRVSYFTGNHPEQWQPNVPVWGGARYVDLYPGMDLEVTGEGGRWMWRLIVKDGRTGSQLANVRLRVEGADTVALNNGRLRLSTAAGGFTLPLLTVEGAMPDSQPGTRRLQHDTFEMSSPFFAAPSHSLFLFPQDTPDELLYSTFVGGNDIDRGYSLALDSSENVVVAGYTESTDFPTAPGAYDESFGGAVDVFVSKLSADGASLLHSTFVGGSRPDFGESLGLDDAGNIVVAGFTGSSNFPTTPGAYDETYNGGGGYYPYDAFVFKLSSDGSSLLYSTFVGGTTSSYYEGAYSLALDSAGNAVVTGPTHSSNFPTTAGAYDTSHNGGYDVFVFKLSADGSSLMYSTFVGGSGDDQGFSLALDDTGNSVVTGYTASSDFPATPGAYDMTHQESDDAFVFKLSADGSSLMYSTFVGGSGDDQGFSLALDDTGNSVVTGYTASSGFPATPGAYDEDFNGGDYDVFVLKLSADGGLLLYSTFMGGDDSEQGWSLVLDSAEDTVVTGGTASHDFPISVETYNESHSGNYDAFIFKLSADGSAVLYSTFIGGSGEDWGFSLALDSAGNAVVTGKTASSDFPTTTGAFDTSYHGGWDSFVAKLIVGRGSAFSISGHVRDGRGNPISGVMVSAGTAGSASTDASGAYTIAGLITGTYMLTPSKNKWKFTPATRTVSVPPSATRHDFIGTLEGVPFFVAINDDGEMYAFPVLDEPHYGYLIGTGSVAAVADFDNDSFCEVLAVRKSDRLLRLYESVDGTSFFEKVVSEDAYPSALVAFSDSVAGDFDNNHLLDFAFTGRRCSYSTEYCSPGGQGLIQVHLNRGKGHFDRRSIDINGILDRRWEGMKGLDDGDFNLDGSLDLAAQQYWGGADNVTHLLLGNGDGTFVDSLSFTNANSNGTVSLVSGDFNNDGYLDLIVGQDDGGDPGQTWLYLGNGTGAFTYYGPAYDTNPADESGDNEPGAGHADAYDFDSDGNLDVVAIAKGIGVLLFKGSGDGSFQTPLILKSGVNWGGVATPPDSQPRCKWGSGPGPTYFISGHVRDGNGDPISGVTVSASAGGSDVTDAGGFYVISRLVTGTYMLAPSKGGLCVLPTYAHGQCTPRCDGSGFQWLAPVDRPGTRFSGFFNKNVALQQWSCS